MVTSLPCPLHVGLAEGDEKFRVVRHLPLAVVEQFVLQEDDRVVVADGALQEPLGVGRGGRVGHVHAGAVHEVGFQRLGVLGRQLAAAAARHADHHGKVDLAAEHVADLGHVVDDLVHGQQGEVDRHQFGHRPQAPHGRADGDADDGVLRDGGILDPLLAEFGQKPPGHLEGPLVERHVLPQTHHRRVAAHLLLQGQVEGIPSRSFSDIDSPSAHTVR